MGAEDIGDNEELTPEEILARARAVFGRPRPGEIAELVFDSLVDEDAPASGHLLRFRHRVLTVEVDVAAEPASSTLMGTIRPAGPARIKLQPDAGEPLECVGSDDGSFRFPGVPHGVVRIELTGSADLPDIRTDWFRI